LKLIPKRKVAPKEFEEGGDIFSYLYQTLQYLTEIYQEFYLMVDSLDDIPDGITYGRVLQTNLVNNALKIITAQSALLDLIPATDDTSDLGSSSKRWQAAYIDAIELGTLITPTTDDTAGVGSSSKKFASGYIKKVYCDTEMYIPSEAA